MAAPGGMGAVPVIWLGGATNGITAQGTVWVPVIVPGLAAVIGITLDEPRYS